MCRQGGVKSMIEKLSKKLINRETVLYFIFGVLTTLVDWGSYKVMRDVKIGYQLATVGSWAAAVAFAFVTNKLFVFCSYSLQPKLLWKELTAFVTCRLLTGLLTLAAMIALVDGMGIKQDFICKIVVSAISLVLNYVLSKLFIFKKAT